MLATEKGATARKFDARLRKKHKDYARESYRTYLTAPEWRNVHMAEEMAAFLKSGKPFYMFPYFSQILTFWKIFFLSLREAHKKHTWFELLTSEYMLMNTFIGVITTIGFVIKGVISLPLWILGPKTNKTEFQAYCANATKDYVDFIHHTPFFLYPYVSKIKPLWQAYWNSKDKTFADTVTLFMATFEYLIRTIPALPSRLMYSQPATADAEQTVSTESDTIHVLLKYKKGLDFGKNDFGVAGKTKPHTTPEERKIDGLSLKEKRTKTKSDVEILYRHAEFKRYATFQAIVTELAKLNEDLDRNVVIKRIAGQDEIQIDFTCLNMDAPLIIEKLGERVMYTYNNSVSDGITIAARVRADELLDLMRETLKDGARTKIKLIHDF